MKPAVVIVFDANVYIRAAVQLETTGWPNDWRVAPTTMAEAALQSFAAVIGRPPDVTSEVDLLVYGCEDLDDVVLRKLSQPADEALEPHLRGLGYPTRTADRIFAQLCVALDGTGRSFSIEPSPGAAYLPGADHEDRCVWGLFRAAMGDRPDAQPVLVTDDRPFALQVNAHAISEAGGGPPLWHAVSPAKFLEML